MENQEFINKSSQFVNSKLQELCYLYITERKNNKNEIGCLIVTFKTKDVNVEFYPLSHPNLTEELKKDVLEKTNQDKSNIIFFIIEEKTNFSYCISKNLV